MTLSDKLFNYCERGLDPGFWAEPLNAVSNAAFLATMVLGARRVLRGPDGPAGPVLLALPALAGLVGVGSFLFHTTASRWAQVADVVPIGAFILVAQWLAARRLLGLSRGTALAAVALLAGAIALGETLACRGWGGALDIVCVAGSSAYLAPLAALTITGALAYRRDAAAGRLLLAAATVFALALTARTLDATLCPMTVLAGRPRGLHVLWHLANAATLFLVIAALARPPRSLSGA